MITCRSPQEIAKIRTSAQLAAATLQHITPMIQAGISTAELDRAAETYIRKHGGFPHLKAIAVFQQRYVRPLTLKSSTAFLSSNVSSQKEILLALTAVPL
jgi:hypothetical protein